MLTDAAYRLFPSDVKVEKSKAPSVVHICGLVLRLRERSNYYSPAGWRIMPAL